MKSRLSCVATFLILGSCQYDPFADRFTTQKPLSQDIVGRYELVQQTVTRYGLSALYGRRSEVELLADGRFIATNLPPQGDDADSDFFAKLLNESGNWRIEPVGGVDSGIGRAKTVWGVYFDTSNANIKPADLTGNKRPYGLIFTIGDPDSGKVMIFERQK